jgi:hypothetical protein
MRRLVEDSTGRDRARAIARSFLLANGNDPEKYRAIAYLGTGFADDEDMRAAIAGESGGIPTYSDGAARYVFLQGGAPGFRKLVENNLPLDFWVVRFFEPDKKQEWKVLVDTRRSRVIGFVNPWEEADPATGAPDSGAATRRALDAAGKLGYPAASYTVVDVGTQNRPKRADTTVVLESRPPGVGQAWPRLTAVFHGPRLAYFLPSVRVPEDFQRSYRKRLAASWLLVGAKVLAIGGVIGVGFLLFLRIVRNPDFRWKSLLPPVAVVAPVAMAGVFNVFPALMRAYPTQLPLKAFQFTSIILLLIGLIVLLCGIGMAFALFFGARPGWRRARLSGSLGDAFARAAVAAVGLAGLTRLTAFVASRFPVAFSFDPSLPGALQTAFPSVAVLWTAVACTVELAAVAAVAALALTHPFFRRPQGRWLGVLMVLVALVPASVHSLSEFFASLGTPVASVAYLALVSFLLLKDHVGAWLLFGVFAFGGRAAANLIYQPAVPDRVSGWIGLTLVLLAAASLLAGRRRESSEFPAPLPQPERSA